MASRGLVDSRCVTTERGRKHLSRGVRDERRPHEPAEPFVYVARGEQLLPAPGEWPNRDDPDPEGGEPPPDARVREDVNRLAKVDSPQDVGDSEAGDDERPGNTHCAWTPHVVSTSFTPPASVVGAPEVPSRRARPF